MRELLTLFVWAFILEILVFFYYLSQASKPFEYYLDVFLLIFTGSFLIYFYLQIKRRGKYEREEDKRDDSENDS